MGSRRPLITICYNGLTSEVLLLVLLCRLAQNLLRCGYEFFCCSRCICISITQVLNNGLGLCFYFTLTGGIGIINRSCDLGYFWDLVKYLLGILIHIRFDCFCHITVHRDASLCQQDIVALNAVGEPVQEFCSFLFILRSLGDRKELAGL